MLFLRALLVRFLQSKLFEEGLYREYIGDGTRSLDYSSDDPPRIVIVPFHYSITLLAAG